MVGELELRQENPQTVVAFIQPTKTENDFHVRYVGEGLVILTPEPCMLKVMFKRSDNIQAMTESCLVQMYGEWNLNEKQMVMREGK